MTAHDKRVALNADDTELVEFMAASGAPPYEAMTPDEAREASQQFVAFAGITPNQSVAVQDETIPRPDAAEPLQVRIYHPTDVDPSAPKPGVMFFHGGGWMVGNLDSHDDVCRKISAELGAIVVSVNYRHAPEHKFPAAPEDALLATRWAYDEAGRLGIDRDTLLVCGDSAGGNLAAVVALAATRGLAPKVCFQILYYPVTDIAHEHPSYDSVTGGLPVTASTMRWFIGAYLQTRDHASDWRASPLLADSVEGVAPAFILTVQHDPLCDEGQAYARRLRDGGVEVTHVHMTGHMHGIVSMGGINRDGEAAITMSIASARASLKAPADFASPDLGADHA